MSKGRIFSTVSQNVCSFFQLKKCKTKCSGQPEQSRMAELEHMCVVDLVYAALDPHLPISVK